MIRVGLAVKITRLALNTPDGAEVYDALSGQRIALLSPQGTFSVSPKENALAFVGTDESARAKSLFANHRIRLPATPQMLL